MSASVSLYHTVHRQLQHTAPTVPAASLARLALLVTGILAARSCVLARVAVELSALALGGTTRIDSIGGRLRRPLNDPHLLAGTCYALLVPQLLGWYGPRPPEQPIVLILDESSKQDQVHLLRLSVAYRGGSLPLAWRCWEQNTPQPAGSYWPHIEAVLAEAARCLPARAKVVVVADRAYALPALIDRLQGYGWHWVVRVTTTGKHRWQDGHGDEHALAALVAQHLPHAGTRFRANGAFGKKAGWRPANLVGIWGRGRREPLVVLTDLPPRWAVLGLYGRRFWIEAGFRADKRRGWQWEASQVRDLDHQQVLLLALAWASLVALCLGAEQAAQQLATRPGTHRPSHARQSLCSLGIDAIRPWLYHGRTAPIPWVLPEPDGPSWTAQLSAAQSRAFIFHSPVLP